MEYIPKCYEIWHSEQVKFVNHKYNIWNCGSWLEIKNLGQIWSQNCNVPNLYEIWHSEQTEHANDEYNTRQCLEHLRDYWLKLIIGSEWQKDINYIGGFTIPSNTYDGTFLRNYQLAALVRKWIN